MAEVDFAELISKIAHELRSPLTAVQGFSGTLVKRWDRFGDEQRLQLIETIHSDAVRMGRIITEVLDLARLETGRLQLNPAQTSVAEIAKRARGNVTRLPGAERVAVEIDGEVTAWADPARLENVLTALIENAVKFSDEGAVHVGAEERADGTVEIAVEDHGEGIPEERIPGLFSGPSAAGASAATPSGSGLGLYLSRRLVEAHGGSIGVTSRPGEGSRFVVTLPARGDGA